MGGRPGDDFLELARSLEDAYLNSDDPVQQSGFSGGRDRWVAERSPLVDAIDSDGDFLDVGCANGLLAEDVVQWASERGFQLVPFGVDIGDRLIALTRQRHARFVDNFVSADAWSWEPKRQWRFVYSLLDLAPMHLYGAWLNKLASWVEPGGRLIIGSYGSRSRREAPEDVGQWLTRNGLEVLAEAGGGDPTVTRFAWAEVDQLSQGDPAP